MSMLAGIFVFSFGIGMAVMGLIRFNAIFLAAGVVFIILGVLIIRSSIKKGHIQRESVRKFACPKCGINLAADCKVCPNCGENII